MIRRILAISLAFALGQPGQALAWGSEGHRTPDYHGWPDRLGFLPSSQAVFNPIGGPARPWLFIDRPLISS